MHKHKREGAKDMVYLDTDDRHWIAEIGGKKFGGFESEAAARQFLRLLLLSPGAAALLGVELEKPRLH
jgi:hypothetical protein